MQPRTLEQIISELNPTFKAQTSAIQQQQALIPQQIQSQEQALNAQKDVAYEDIVSGARRRGLGFSGIPLGEQAKYAATQYAPALAGLRQQGQQQALTLQQALLGINERRDTLGQQIYQTEQDRYFQSQEAEKNRRAQAAASAALMPTLGSLGGQQQTSNPLPKINRDKSGGYQFTDGYGTPINAAEYSQLTGVGYRQLLSQMASTGDKNAKLALQYVGNDARFGSAPQQYASALKALGAQGNYVSQAVQNTSRPVQAGNVTLPSIFNGVRR